MTDNLKIKQPQDPKQVNVNEPWELNYWSNKWSVTHAQLKDAVKVVGPHVDAVRVKLGK
ncbi:DUF3606 domain-containing protein [Paraburkholderia solisilvae]|uniref:DUF3606 domain-containing protein n=1 Tax=Paraburkholderia solisilvae TaxID=624376 RepID=A0A6J5E202_9BURK|nr:DUF3606 domain-containing protein [Paraburkholderia solisilvae]CAB3759421.1 hypothetical protein LMG29739_03149 [Paraburkholderia solisilvae]